MAETVDGGGVDPVDAVVEGGVDGGDGLVVILWAPGELPAAAAHGPGADSDGSEFEVAIAEPPFLHLFYNSGRRKCDGGGAERPLCPRLI